MNEFSYQPHDAKGLRCPFSAHIRVTNPRDQPLNPIVDPDVPPLLRRSLSYGPEWVPGTNDDADRGLLGLFLCSSIERQFQQINRWMNSNDFSPAFEGTIPTPVDPLSHGDRTPGQHFPSPSSTPRVRSKSSRSRCPDPSCIPGTAYFLLPGMTTLKQIMQ